MEQTAANTAETNEQLLEINKQLNETNNTLEKVVYNQNDYIDMLKEQLGIQCGQLYILKNIFTSSEDAVHAEKEIMQIIREQIDENHPLWDYVKDKGTDVAIAGIPVIYNTIKMFLASKGIMFP